MKKSMYILAISMVGLTVTSVITVLTANVYVADLCIVFICLITFQLGINTDNLNGKQANAQQAQSIKDDVQNISKKMALNSFKNIFSWIYALTILFCLLVVYKIAVWDLLKDGWMKYGVIISFVIGSWITPYMAGNFAKKVPYLKNNLALR